MTQLTYVVMRLVLAGETPLPAPPVENLILTPLSHYNPDDLWETYSAAFKTGDAQFFHHQSDQERLEYFQKELGFPAVLSHPGSFALRYRKELIGFALVMDYLENNYHISCMCLTPGVQGRGLGKYLLDLIKHTACQNEIGSLTLGTELTMKAYQLYLKGGFDVIEEHTVDL